MAIELRVTIILALIIASTLISMSTAISGTATFYNTYAPSACYGFQPQPQGTLIAAANPSIYNHGAACGTRYKIQCKERTNDGVLQPCRNGDVITVTVADLCPICQDNQFDLSQEAFSTIADTNAGKILIDYNQ